MVFPVAQLFPMFHYWFWKETLADNIDWGPEENQPNSCRAQRPTASVSWIQVGWCPTLTGTISFWTKPRYLDLLSDQETESEGNPFRCLITDVKCAHETIQCMRKFTLWSLFIREEKEGMREDGSRILPILALNEVFIGESLSSRVSYLELQVTFAALQKYGFWLAVQFLTPHCIPKIVTTCMKRLISSSHLKQETVASALPLELVSRILHPRFIIQLPFHSLN